MCYRNQIYIGTVLLEKNRWSSREPSFPVSEWLDRFERAGFNGVELWENHALSAPVEEQQEIAMSKFPIAIFNSYASCDDEGETERKRAVELVGKFNSKGMKFNLGKQASCEEMYIKNVKAWREKFAGDFRMLCECHPGTIIEEPEKASGVFDKLGRDKYQVIYHPFLYETEVVQRWFRFLGDLTTHIHVQIRTTDDKIVQLKTREGHFKDILQVLKDRGFNGSWTVEFTNGVGEPHEDIEELFKAAAEDLNFLREHLL
jgi:sugar phosphate isomerase/epimerase